MAIPAHPAPGSPGPVAFATSAAFPDSPADDRLALEALRARGVVADPVVWNSPEAEWSRFSVVVVRSTWDYQYHRDEFLAWVDRTARSAPLWNPAPMIRWNLDKRYLLELAEAGLPVVPSVRVPRGTGASLRSLAEKHGWPEVVVKPSVGAGGHNVRRFLPLADSEGEAHLGILLRDGDAIVQPYLSAAHDKGERSLVFFGETFSHAISHAPAPKGSEKVPRPLSPTRAEIDAAAGFVGWLDPLPLYARLDFLPDEDGSWLLSEMELIEPELYFRCAPEAAGRFADLLLARLGTD